MSRARVLLLDPDDEIATQFLQSGQPWVVERARSFAEALKLTAAFSYDFAIIEMMLPDCVGTDAWIALSRQQPTLFGIMTTSSRSLHANVNPNNDHILAYLLKPFKMDAVCDFVAQSIGAQSAQVTRLAQLHDLETEQ
jgi:DNA-binding NtrC family response regulator